MIQGHCDGNMGGIYPGACTGGYPPKSARLVALMGVASGLIFRGQAAKLHLAAMSAFPESGRSDTLKSTIMKGRFRPQADAPTRKNCMEFMSAFGRGCVKTQN